MNNLSELHKNHSRHYFENQYVYPVISRRSKGLSIGINLNPGKDCNFHCLYCQVERNSRNPKRIAVDVDIIFEELKDLVTNWKQNGLKDHPTIGPLKPSQKILRDIALSGDGEPTTAPEFEEVCKRLSTFRQTHLNSIDLNEVSFNLITNSTQIHKESVQRGIHFLTQHKGIVWAKLDAGTPDWYNLIDSSSVSFKRIINNLQTCVQNYPTAIQTLICSVNDILPSKIEMESYVQILESLYQLNPNNVKEIQLHSLARVPSSSSCKKAPSEFLKDLAQKISSRLPISVQIY